MKWTNKKRSSLESLNFSIKKNWMSWYKNSLSHLRAHTIRERPNQPNEWMNTRTQRSMDWHGRVCVLHPVFFLFSLFLLSLACSLSLPHTHYHHYSCTNMHIHIKFACSSMRVSFHSNNSITTWSVHTNYVHELNTKWHKILHWTQNNFFSLEKCNTS